MILRGFSITCLAAGAFLTGCASSPKEPDAAATWRQEFGVSPTALRADGQSTYAFLVPGRVAEYAAGADTLTITVLNETIVIDGVTCRVVEERETEEGKLAEVSRNFFAIDARSGDLYYFGEDVDDYKDGQITGHSGAWRSGVNGAKYGLLLPGSPRVDDRFYQEVAPGVAMDRAHVTSVSETVKVAAGTFEGCVLLEETTPLEKGVSRKWYAPGVGLVKDDKMELVRVR